MEQQITNQTSAPVPTPSTELLGRGREMAEATALLRDGARLLTLTGPGGVGKTRLALALAGELRPDFPHGVAWADLAPLADGDLVAGAVARAVGAREDSARSPFDALVARFRDGRVLLVLDNCEHLRAAAGALVSPLLAACPRLAILATSRASLRLVAEQAFPVAPLDVAVSSEGQSGSATESAAVRLFVARARTVRPGFAATAENAADVVEICRRLDGLPLAIELAAARLRALSPATLRALLEQRLDLASVGPVDLPPRQRTIRAALAWTHDLLEADEQAFFRRLAVFAGGFGLDAAAAIAAAGDSLAALDRLDALTDHSLVFLDEHAAGDARYRMLETVREYAAERLQVSGEEGATREVHAGVFLDLATRAADALHGPDQRGWYAVLDAELDNLRAALGWAIEGRRGALAQRLATALWRYWEKRGHLREGRRWLERALDAGDDGPPEVRARAHHFLGNIALDLGDLDEAEWRFAAGLAIRRELPGQPEVNRSLNGLGLVAYYRGEYDRARALHEECRSLALAAGDRLLEAFSLSNLGDVATAVGDLDEGRRLQQAALDLRRALGDGDGAAFSVFNLGEAAFFAGGAGEAERLLGQALATFRDIGDRQGIAHARAVLGLVALAGGDWGSSAEHLLDALSLRDAMGDRLGRVECLEGLAELAAMTGHPLLGARLSGAATRHRTELGIPVRPVGQARRVAAVARLRAALTDDLFASAWAAGETLSLDAAVAEAATFARSVLDGATPAAAPVPRSGARPDAAAPGATLSDREVQVLRLVMAGRTDREIAAALAVSPRTVTTHVSNILRKLGVHSRQEAANEAVRRGIVESPA